MLQTNSAASFSNTLDIRLLVAKIPLIDEFDAYCLDFKCHMNDLFEFDKVASNFALELETPRESKAEEDELKTRFKKFVALLELECPGYVNERSSTALGTAWAQCFLHARAPD
ncbi:hypothetical protein ABVK25_006595 [Lepraria finkii]|uniref:Uncharacterized protein n=1 Tax=Lepraria finkii TaxID=1340010 RepID=A0ABR4B5Y6_9LECA